MKGLLRQRGVTLIELIISIVVIGIAAAAILAVYTTVIRASADPMIRAQAIAIGEAYMEEILAQPISGSASPGDDRADLDNVPAYDELSDSGAHNAEGEPIDGLEDYQVDVLVTADNTFATGNEFRIDVSVADQAGTVNITLSSWRVGE
ncbi:MSHA pilin protein MshD [Natronospira proteinivora]|uniref:MSHA pilin protein MshD n=1 Tax=Natronospira proteinivora TaxID=1807133 RepID=A0ABT1G9Z9_9GAMM|nr:prepilin-type N-terminal cleavage/methylation domain-containing protein [Natronospira proteinivora]MCP1728086.1 MSHA pilin protein MshD [Natronospira proteinivora]